MTPIPNSIAAMASDLTAWRRDLHQNPELGYQETRTMKVIAEKLRAWGFNEVVTGIGKTGVVGVLHGRNGPGRDGEGILLRSDMDALPILEETGAGHASINQGVMHACGHDGHMTMLLGAAKHLSETRNFDGTVYFCFQPAEEGGAGAKAMIDDGLFQRFPARAVFGMHNFPGFPAGHFACVPGPVMAAADEFVITIKGQGSHAAYPHEARDPLLAGAQIVTAMQSIVSRKIDPLRPCVVSVTKFQCGTACNIIADEAVIAGTTRSFDPEVFQVVHDEIRRICTNVAEGMGVEVVIEHESEPYPATVNDADQTEFAAGVLESAFGEERVVRNAEPTMGGEDFAFMANEKPGCFVFIGIGDQVSPLHTSTYDFNDEVTPVGVTYWSKLVETALPAA